eukprot:273648-Lingulodinium_polyedra.AAC.1
MAFPLSFAALLHPDPSVQKRQLAWMQQCFEAYQRLCSEPSLPAAAREVKERSWFQHQLVKEVFAHALAAEWPTVGPMLAQILERAFTGLGQTKVVEDGVK